MTNRPLSEAALCLIETPDDIADFARWLGERRPVLGLDCETEGLEWADGLRTVQLGDAMSGWVIDFNRWGGLAQWALNAYTRPMALHNAGFDIHHLERNGCFPRRELIDDTLIMAHLLDPPGVHGLKPLSKKLVDPHAMVGQQVLDEAMRKQKWTWATVPISYEGFWVYSAADPIETARLWEIFKPQIDAGFSGIYDLDLAALWPNVDAERLGMNVDADYAREYSARLQKRAVELSARAREDFDVSPGSSEQVTARWVADGVPLTKMTKGGRFSADKEVLEGLAENDRHPLARLVLDYKRAVKFRGAYCEAVLTRLDVDGLVHPRINTMGARTGRMSISTPPLQQIPSHASETRRMFIPRYGRSLVSVDFSNIEIRLLAHFSQDPVMLEAFRQGVDIHSMMARRMYPAQTAGLTDTEMKDSPFRKHAKSGTLGKQYGIGVETFAVQQGVSIAEARKFLDDYGRGFPDVIEFLQHVQDTGAARFKAENLSYVRTPAGRLGTLTRGEAYDKAHYKLAAMLIQGYAADLMKDALVRLAAAGMTADRFILPVHDECLFDVPAEDAEEFGREAAEIMASVGAGLSVPITTDVEIYADNWGQAIKE